MRSASVIVLSFLTVAPLTGAMAQAQMNAERNPDSEMAPSVSSIKKNYPGGRDDSNLTVQPFKRITKKESENRSVDPEEEDYDQGNASSGFGE